jgi:hypothetical protein
MRRSYEKYAVYIVVFVHCSEVALADTIFMKNGLKIEGEIASVGADSVTIKTTSGRLTIAVIESEKIETAEPKPEKREISEGGIPQSIKSVGFGCLGGAIGGGLAGIVAVMTDGYGNSGEATAIIVIGASIAGIITGVIIGAK